MEGWWGVTHPEYGGVAGVTHPEYGGVAGVEAGGAAGPPLAVGCGAVVGQPGETLLLASDKEDVKRDDVRLYSHQGGRPAGRQRLHIPPPNGGQFGNGQNNREFDIGHSGKRIFR